MKISLFPNAYESTPEVVDCTWADLVQILGPHEFTRSDKNDSPAFSPAEYAPGTTQKLAANVLQLHLFVLDIDHATEEQVGQALDEVVDLGLAAVVYSSWSHATKPWSVRIVIPLTRPVSAAEWVEFWPRANSVFRLIGDYKCRNVDRIYYRPLAPAGTEEAHFRFVADGQPLDVDEVLQLPLPAPPYESLTKLPLDRLERFALTLSRSRDDHKSELGAILKRVCKGEEFAQPGSRDDTIFRLACLLGERFHDYDPDSIAAHFAPSLQLMEKLSQDCPKVKDVAYKIRRQQESRAKEKEKPVEEARTRIREAWGSERAEPYTPEEITSFGLNIDKRHIIQYETSFFVHFNGEYKGPYTEGELRNVSVRWLAPARSMGVELYKLTKQGELVPKSVDQLVQQYGTVAEELVLDLAAQRTIYYEQDMRLVEAPCPVRKLSLKFHPEIDQWLTFLGGKKVHKFKSWLAAVTWLHKPCRCLFLTGKRSIGKGMIALGTSGVFSTAGPSPLSDVFSNFNDLLADCPLCLADEQLPKDHRGHAKSAELREHVQALQRSFRRKFLPNCKMLGATRTMVTANNEDVLSTQENLTKNDIDAIADRYLHVEANSDECLAYLKTVDTSKWVDDDMIAEHVLWLGKYYEWQPEGRFLIEDDDESTARSLTVRDGTKSAVCEWLVNYLKEPVKFHTDPRSNLLVRKRAGQLLVNVQGLANCWDQYVIVPKLPSTGQLARALAGICETDDKDDPRLRLKDTSGRWVKYRLVDIEFLVVWCDITGVWEREEMLVALRQDTEEKFSISVGLN